MANTPESISVPIEAELVSLPNATNRQVALVAASIVHSGKSANAYTVENTMHTAEQFLEWLDKDDGQE